MADAVISVEDISKSYRLGVIGTGTFRGDVQRWWARLRGQPDPLLKVGERDHGNRDGETIWALKNVGFKLERGETLGIIGRNGAGKSTLLKILSQVTAPTSGQVRIWGRIASLLEVGTGFHPDLTGRENIYLNGAMLGMRKAEIQRKFDEIVDFSGVETFIDTPVKRYSSGMYVRLGFAVAAHVDPEILVVDEVLAVGDAEFQKKCLGKMGKVAQEGRTVLFVSHNMGMITSLCRRAIGLNQGAISYDGTALECVRRYYSSDSASPFDVDFSKQERRIGDEYATLLRAQVEDQNGRPSGEIDINAPFKIRMSYELHRPVAVPPYANLHIYNSKGECAFLTASERIVASTEGKYEAVCQVPGNLLNNDSYSIGLALTFTHAGLHVSFFEQGALSVIIHESADDLFGEGRRGYSGVFPGAVRPKLQWEVTKLD